MHTVSADVFLAEPAGSYVVVPSPYRDLANVVLSLTEAGWRPLLVSGAHLEDKSKAIAAIGVGLGAPTWFGHNWDAVVDLVRDRCADQPLAIVIDADPSFIDPSFIDPSFIDPSFIDPSFADPDSSRRSAIDVVSVLGDIVDQLADEGSAVKLGLVPRQSANLGD